MRAANIGCERPAEGWFNFDMIFQPVEKVRPWDIREPLGRAAVGEDFTGFYKDPFDSLVKEKHQGDPLIGYFDVAVAHHVLSMLDHHELVPALRNIREVLKPGGWLRISDLNAQAGIDAWYAGQEDWFPQDERTGGLAAKFCTWMTWYGTRKSVFVPAYLYEVVANAGFSEIHIVPCCETRSGEPGITELDARQRESVYLEARK